ncbi:EAL domain-containing protein [Vogesella sp. LIG4]|uniref:EAL domain-containing response regulator n=1 Tax=Vogesella sp. LIG4 TaxID=1192162 RepID=UPI0008200593|nr:EAL domain-containing response regulator [Vogesella sp. LIG4]SCK29339.1 EAL domain, c-di-GMP-specific phosphodiesterase class I (or its enzymatically inactive variant) [Vogesella sp. LIG4]
MDTQIELSPLIRRFGVLVVDDSAVQRHSAVELLRGMGVEQLYEAADGHDALKLLRMLQPTPAVILLDLEMPGMDGIETAQQLVQEENCPSLLIASSAEPSILNAVAGMAEALGLPLLGTLRKPLTQQTLSLALAHFESTHVKGVAATPPPQVAVPALAEALQQRQIIPYYQPKIRMADGEVAGLEALARWRQPDGKLVPPVSFIEVAEKNGLIDELTLTILDQVLHDLVRWHALGFNPTVAINVSAPSLSDRGFGNAIIERTAAANIPPSAIVLEITESALVGDLAAALGTLGRLRLKGFGLSIDDYGTGFSSMQQLSRLPFSELKLDGSFVRHSPDKWQLRTILEAAVSMGQRLGLATVAEGVETQKELALLYSLGCEYAQGYLIAAPMPAAELPAWAGRERERLQGICRLAAASRGG